MLARAVGTLGQHVTAIARRTMPDPFVLAVLLTLAAAALALTLGDFSAKPQGTSRAAFLLDAWRGSGGLWRFLAFAMQMCLVLVTGHALAESPPVRALSARLAGLPRSAPAAAATVALVACLLGIVHWGLGLIVGALFARDVARAMHARGVGVPTPLLAAAGYTAMLVWHGGLSGSAPLTSTTIDGAAKVLPPDAVALLPPGGVPLTQTLLSPLNLVVTGGLLVLVPAAFWLLCPRGTVPAEPSPSAREAPPTRPPADSIPDWLHHTPWLSGLLALALLAGFARYATVQGVASLGLDELNALMLALGLLLHGSTAGYLRAAEDGARGCAGILLQFPLYGGIMGLLGASGLIAAFAHWSGQVAGEGALPVLTCASAALVNLFVPSGGGQWAIQGPIALHAGAEAGIPPGRMIMAVAYGDQLTNMLQPFWALPLLAITGVRARDIVGYTALVMLLAAAWSALWLLVL